MNREPEEIFPFFFHHKSGPEEMTELSWLSVQICKEKRIVLDRQGINRYQAAQQFISDYTAATSSLFLRNCRRFLQSLGLAHC